MDDHDIFPLILIDEMEEEERREGRDNGAPAGCCSCALATFIGLIVAVGAAWAAANAAVMH